MRDPFDREQQAPEDREGDASDQPATNDADERAGAGWPREPRPNRAGDTQPLTLDERLEHVLSDDDRAKLAAGMPPEPGDERHEPGLEIPDVLPILPLKEMVVYPFAVAP